MRSTDRAPRRASARARLQRSSSTNQAMLAGGRDHQQPQPGQRVLGSIFSMIDSGSTMSVPPQPVPGSATLK
jgi:hypothetical protein